MKKKRGLKNNFHLSNKLSYTLIAIGILLIIGVGVYAYQTTGTANPATMGHTINEVAPPTPCSAGQVLSYNGANWVCITSVSLPGCSNGQTVQFNGNWVCANSLAKSTLIYQITNTYCAGIGGLSASATCPAIVYGGCSQGTQYYNCGPSHTGCIYNPPLCSNNPIGSLVN